MKLKLDECLDVRFVHTLEKAGFEVATVYSQKISGSDDWSLYEICKAEERVLVTLDSHFTDILRYPSANTKGIVVLRGHDGLFPTVSVLVDVLIDGMKNNSPIGKLWIVEENRIRIRGQ
ncbi:MAG: DUF5615 family PIN-like protein [Planctomycetes bacterium]|nr:DUF5615 family PIN-like protein [Planctomycetota bacterium]